MGANWQRFTVLLPSTVSDPKEKLALGEDIIKYIRERTRSSKDNKGKDFPKYSKEYRRSLDFKIARKSGTVNLTQTGDMLQDIEVLSMSKDKIVIGFEKGSESNDKADGHITGWQGRSDVRRPFLGFEGSEKAKLKSMIKKHETGISEDQLKALVYMGGKDIKKSKVLPLLLDDEGF
jgi:hypothetical protein